MAYSEQQQPLVVPVGAGGAPYAGLDLVLGPANSGKLGRVVAWWQQALPWRPLIVVPTAAVAEEVTRELLRRTDAFVGQAQALTFDGLVGEVLGEKPVYAGEFQREILIAGILRDARLSALDSAVRFPGLVTALDSLLLQVAESGRTADELDDILGEWARRQPETAALAADLRRVSDAYAAGCASTGAVDRPAAVRAACERADEWSRPVAFYGFTSFTAGQRRLIEGMARRVPVLLSFDHDRGRSVNLARPAEVARWERIAGHVAELPPQPRAYSCPAIAFLERRLFEVDGDLAPPVAGADGVRFLLAAGERNEAELVAQHVVALIDEGFVADDIAIIVHDMSGRGRLMAQVLDSCGVPYRLDAGLMLAETGLGHAFLNALGGVVRSDPDTLLAYLGGPYSGLTWDESADLELRYRRDGADDFQALAAIVDAEAPQVLASIRGALEGDEGLSLDPAALHRLACEMLAAGMEGEGAFDGRLEQDVRAFDALQGALCRAGEDVGRRGPAVRTRPRYCSRMLGPSAGAARWRIAWARRVYPHSRPSPGSPLFRRLHRGSGRGGVPRPYRPSLSAH